MKFGLDMHEIAVVSGFGAAYRLGASYVVFLDLRGCSARHSNACSRYPFRDNKDCKRLFALCLAANHMMRMVCGIMIHFVQGTYSYSIEE